MKTLVKSIAAAAAMYAAAATGAVLPRVGNGTTPNVWTRNISGVLSAAKTTNLPILLVMINDSSTGEGCQHCMQFVNRTLNTENFANVVAKHKFYMVLLNDYRSPQEPDYGGVSEEVFNDYFYKYQYGDNGYPQVVLIRPNGTRYTVWSYRTNPGTSGTILYQFIDEALSALSPSSTVISLSSQSGNVVPVQVDSSSPTMTPGVWTGVVTRSGGSGKAGTVSISLSGEAASRYQLSENSLPWDASDGMKTFTITGPLSFDGGIVVDTVTVGISASGFDGSDISYGTTSQTVTFKDTRVKSTLAEFAAATAGLGGLSSSDGAWFVPMQDDGNVLETLTSGDSTLSFRATVGGILTATAGSTDTGAILATDDAGEIELVADTPVRFGVAAGQVITFKASAHPEQASATIGFREFSFSQLPVTLSKPVANAQIPYNAMVGDKSLVDLAWSAGFPGCTFSLTCNGAVVDMGTVTSGNAIDLGFVHLVPETRTCVWGVSASYTEDGLRGIAVGTASSSFTVAALPVYDNVPSSVVAYKSVGSQIDMSVDSAGGGGVTYSASGLPQGMKINAATGVITGTPKKAQTYSVTVTASNPYGSASASFNLSVEKFPKEYSKPKYALFFFGGDDAILASAQFSVTSSGKWNAKVSESGRVTKPKGSLVVFGDGRIATGSPSLDIVYDPTTGIWSGSGSGCRVYGKARDKANATWKGSWNIGFATSSAANLRGWAVAKVVSSGDISFSGLISNKIKISGGCYSAEFPERFVAAHLPRWAGHGNVRFGHGSAKNGTSIWCTLYPDGTLDGDVSYGAQEFDIVEGSFWSKAAIARLNGSVFRTIGGGNVEIPVVASATKISAGDNGYGARLSCNARAGKMSAAYKLDGKQCKATGVIYEVGGRAKASGGGMLGNEAYSFTIE